MPRFVTSEVSVTPKKSYFGITSYFYAAWTPSSPGHRGPVGPHRPPAAPRAGEADARAAGRRREVEEKQDATLAITSG